MERELFFTTQGRYVQWGSLEGIGTAASAVLVPGSDSMGEVALRVLCLIR